MQDAISLARTEDEPETAAKKLTEAAYTRGSADNITCIVVKFHHDKTNANVDSQTVTHTEHAAVAVDVKASTGSHQNPTESNKSVDS